MTNTFNRHIAAIKHTVTRSNIIGMRKAFNAQARAARGYSTSCTAPQWSAQDVAAAHSAVQRYQPVITGDMHATGVATLWRADKRYKGRFTPAQRAVIANIWYFRLVDWYEDGLMHYPVIRAIAQDGTYFDFINVPWQSGGNGPEIWPYVMPVARVAPLWSCSVTYVTPSGAKACYSRYACTGESLSALQDGLIASLHSDPKRKVMWVLLDTFRADFSTMQISASDAKGFALHFRADSVESLA